MGVERPFLYIKTGTDSEADISGSNLAYTCPGLAHLSRDDLFEVIGIPETEDLIRIDGQPLEPGVPKQLVERADWSNWVDEDEEDIRIIDFGEVFVAGSNPGFLAQPPELRAPETIFPTHLDHRVDLWSAGITVCSFVRASIN